MNKLVVVAVILLAIALLALPPALGMLTETQVRDRVTALNDGGVVSADVVTFERGWFGSKAQIEIGVASQQLAGLGGLGAGGDPAGPEQRMLIAVDFAHGPIAVLDGVHFGWSKMVARPDTSVLGVADFQAQLGVPHLFEFRGRTGFGGDLEFDADIPPIDFPFDEAHLLFSGAFLEGRYAGPQLVADVNFGSVEFSSPTGTFAVRNLRGSVDNEIRSQYVMPGQTEFSIDSITIVDGLRAAMPVFEATNMRVTSDATLDDAEALLAMEMTYGVDSVRVEDSEIAAATLGLALRNLDVAALEAYSAALRDLTPVQAATEPAALVAALAPQIDRALRAGPSLTLDPIRFRLDGEPLEGRLELLTNTARLPPAGALNLDNPLLVLGLLNSNAELRVSKALAQRLATLGAQMQLGGDPSIPPDQVEYMAEAQAGLMLVTLVGQGVLVEDGDGYRTEVQFTDGALTLNGNPLPFGLP